MTLKIISPKEILFEGEVRLVTLPGAMGAFTVLRNHASLISELVDGNVCYNQISASEDADLEKIRIPGGVVVVDDNVISVCVN